MEPLKHKLTRLKDSSIDNLTVINKTALAFPEAETLLWRLVHSFIRIIFLIFAIGVIGRKLFIGYCTLHARIVVERILATGLCNAHLANFSRTNFRSIAKEAWSGVIFSMSLSLSLDTHRNILAAIMWQIFDNHPFCAANAIHVLTNSNIGVLGHLLSEIMKIHHFQLCKNLSWIFDQNLLLLPIYMTTIADRCNPY